MSTKNAFLSKYSKKQPYIGDKNIFEKTKYEILRHNYLVLDALATSLGYIIALEKGYIFRGYFEQVELSPFGDLIIDTGNLEKLVEIAQNNLDKTDDESIKFIAVEDSVFLLKISCWRSDVLSKLKEIVSENDDIMRVRIADIDEKFREETLKLVSDYPSSFKDLCYIHHSENDLRTTIAMIIKTIGYIHIYINF